MNKRASLRENIHSTALGKKCDGLRLSLEHRQFWPHLRRHSLARTENDIPIWRCRNVPAYAAVLTKPYALDRKFFSGRSRCVNQEQFTVTFFHVSFVLTSGGSTGLRLWTRLALSATSLFPLAKHMRLSISNISKQRVLVSDANE